MGELLGGAAEIRQVIVDAVLPLTRGFRKPTHYSVVVIGPDENHI